MQVVLTRPIDQARPWQEALQAAGHVVWLLPLIEIGPVQALPAQSPNRAALQATQARCADFDHIMFVSPNAVRCFLQDLRLLPRQRCWATGAGTAAALQAAGVPIQQIDTPSATATQWDSEHLWQAVQGRWTVGQQLLIVRGANTKPAASPDASPNTKDHAQDHVKNHAATTSQGLSEALAQAPSILLPHPAPLQASGRNWLAGTARAAGLVVSEVVAYVRQAPAWTNEQRRWMREVGSCCTWLFSSSQAIAHLPSEAQWPQTPAWVTHPRMAAAAQQKGFAVRVCRPGIGAVLQALKNQA